MLRRFIPRTATMLIVERLQNLVFYAGQVIDETKYFKVTAKYNDGTTSELSPSEYTTNKRQPLTLADNGTELIISYQNCTAEFTITVYSYERSLTGIEIESLSKTEYAEGEKIEAAGFELDRPVVALVFQMRTDGLTEKEIYNFLG